MSGFLNNMFGFKKEKQGKKKQLSFPILIVIGVFVFILVSFFMSSYKKAQGVKQKAKQQERSRDLELLSKDNKEDSFVSSVEGNVYGLEKQVKELSKHVSDNLKKMAELRQNQSDLSQAILDMDQKIMLKIDEKFEELQEKKGSKGSGIKKFISDRFDLNMDGDALELEIAELNDRTSNADMENSVYLPLGSFVRGTLLTGVYAPSDENKPLPVLIALTEAFYGPNNTRIPLNGSFVLGKAVGDLVSSRVIVQIVSMSSVLPNGVTFEREANLGYLTDIEGQLGIPGKVVYKTGKQLGLSFLTGFMSGASEAFADAETTSVTGSDGQVVKNVTGSSTKNAAFSGLSKSASDLSQYYQDQVDDLVPAVEIKSGVEVYFVVQKGVKIEGLKNSFDSQYRFVD